MVSRSNHHFYVEQATKRSTWNHPYDDPKYLESIPDTHPAHPESAEAQAMRDKVEQERARLEEYKRKWEAEHGKSPSGPQQGQSGHESARTGGLSQAGNGNDGQSQSSRIDLLQWQAQKQHHKGVFGKLDETLHLSKEERQKHKEEKQKAQAEQRRLARVSRIFPHKRCGIRL